MCPPSCWPSLAPTSRNHMLLAATCRRISWRLNMHIYGLMFQCAGRMIFWVTRNYNCFCPSAVKVEYSQSTSVSQIGCCLQARFIQCTFLLDCIFKLSDPWYSFNFSPAVCKFKDLDYFVSGREMVYRLTSVCCQRTDACSHDVFIRTNPINAASL